MRKIVKVYKGDNGTQEFRESADGFALARNKQSEWWIACNDCLKKEGNIAIELADDKVWQNVGKPRMELRRAHV